MEDRTVRQAWEQFILSGVGSACVRHTVLASWQRSRGHAIAVDRRGTELLSEAELHRRRQRHRRLLAAARPALGQAAYWLQRSGCMALLTSEDGVVLEVAGDDRALAQGEEIGLQPGGRWSESVIGTNAIGTAIAADTPVQIHAAEHFCAGVQQWTCAAAPIRDPGDGRVLGVLDLSGRCDTFSQRNLAYAVALAQQVEAKLCHERDLDRVRVLHHVLDGQARWPGDTLIAVDQYGRILHASSAACQALRRQDATLLLDDQIGLLRGQSPTSWASALRARLPQAELALITDEGRDIGALIVLPQREVRSAATAPAVIRSAPTSDPFDAIIGASAVLREACAQARQMALSGAPVLIEGETGVGKELFARAIHGLASPDGPFVPLNCGGMPRELIGSELFGYERGAFTGADAHGKVGKIEAAQGGTLCLDEIGEMPLELQPYLLRVLEDGVVYRIGSSAARQVQTRLVSMTNRELRQESAAGRFRRDLYYRVAVLRLSVPPLRERGDDVVLLAEHYARLAAQRAKRAVPGFTSAALACLCDYPWPGNVRELRNVVEAVVFLHAGGQIGLEDLHAYLLRPVDEGVAPARDLRSLEREAVLAALRDCHGNVSQAARKLGIARSTLYCRMADYGLLTNRDQLSS